MKVTQKKRSSSSLLNLVVQLRNIYKPPLTPPSKKKKNHHESPSPKMVLHRQSCVIFKKRKEMQEKNGEAQINDMLLIYRRRWKYKIEIITIHVQHAGLIFNADFFLFFLHIFEYNQAGNKSMKCCIKCHPLFTQTPHPTPSLVDRSWICIKWSHACLIIFSFSFFWREISGPDLQTVMLVRPGLLVFVFINSVMNLQNNNNKKNSSTKDICLDPTSHSYLQVSLKSCNLGGEEQCSSEGPPFPLHEESLHYKQLIYKRCSAWSDSTSLVASLLTRGGIGRWLYMRIVAIWWIILLIWI